MLWTAQGYGGHEQLEVLSQGSKCYEKLKAMADMNVFGSWAQGTRCSQQLKAMDYMTNFELWAQSFRYYEQLKVVVDMKYFRS